MVKGQVGVEVIAAVIASIAALTFAYGYIYLSRYYYEFGLGWYVNSIAVSDFALVGASMVVGVFMWAVASYFVASIHVFLYKLMMFLYVVGFCFLVIGLVYTKVGFGESVTETLDVISDYKFLAYMVAGLGFGLLFVAIENRSLALAFLLFYTLLVGFFYFLPSMLGQEKAAQIIAQKEGVAPKIKSGDYEGWSILGVHDGRAVLVGFEREGFKWTSKVAFADLTLLDIGTPKYAIYKLVPQRF